MNRIQALHTFWSGFGIPAMDESSVSANAMNPDSLEYLGKYLTYDVTDSGWDEDVPMMANLWYRDTSWQEITEKAMEIGNYLSRGGRIIDCDEGAIWIKKAPTFAQRLSEESNQDIRRIVLSIEVEYVINL